MKNSILSIIFLFVALTTTLAQHQQGGGDHKHASTHGGTVKSAGDYHLELLQKADMLTVYLLDASQKTLPREVANIPGKCFRLLDRPRG